MTRWVIGLALLASSCWGCAGGFIQAPRAGLDADAIATTFCDDSGQVRTAIDASLFQILPDGTVAAPSALQEVLVHEQVHRAQLEGRRVQAGHCPPPMTWEQLLQDEVQAYCVSFDYALKREVPAERVGAIYAKDLEGQFHQAYPDARSVISARWQLLCPQHALVWEP